MERIRSLQRLSPTDREEYLRAHLEVRYNIRVDSLQRLDKGVFSVTLHDGRHWIARVFPAERSMEHVEGDASVLRFLEQYGFPAERCAATEPVSTLYGRGILITEYIEGTDVASSEHTLRAYGEMLGRLNKLPAEDGKVAREAGSLHHYARGGGGLHNELLAAASWLAAIEDRVPKETRALYESLREQVAEADTCRGLPEALIHPDPVLKNVLVTTSNELVLIDWTGAGRGPRLASLAILIWTCALKPGGWSPRHVDAVVAGYRSHIRLEESELARLAAVMRIRPLVFACWRYRHAMLSKQPPRGSEWWWPPDDDLVQAIAARACSAFRK